MGKLTQTAPWTQFEPDGKSVSKDFVQLVFLLLAIYGAPKWHILNNVIMVLIPGIGAPGKTLFSISFTSFSVQIGHGGRGSNCTLAGK